MASTPTNCPQCDHPLEEEARYCARCGAPVGPGVGPHRSRLFWMFVALAGTAALFVATLGVVVTLVMYLRSHPAAVVPPAGGTPPAAQAAPTSTRTPAPSATQAAATPMPTLTPAQRVNYRDVSFNYDPAVAAGVNLEVAPAATPLGPDGPDWDGAPEHTFIELTDYVLPGEAAGITIYPVEAYIIMHPEVRGSFEALAQLLDERPAQVDASDSIPYIGMSGIQKFHEQVRYIDFQNGSGVRFLTEYGFDVYPISNGMMFYAFSGLTADGKYYIQARLPVANAVIPPVADMSAEEYQKFADGYPEYLRTTLDALGKAEATSFTPSFEALDALFESLEVRGE